MSARKRNDPVVSGAGSGDQRGGGIVAQSTTRHPQLRSTDAWSRLDELRWAKRTAAAFAHVRALIADDPPAKHWYHQDGAPTQPPAAEPVVNSNSTEKPASCGHRPQDTVEYWQSWAEETIAAERGMTRAVWLAKVIAAENGGGL